MGVVYHPIVQGEIDGHKIGVITSLSIYEYTRNLNFEEFGTEYWIGFGIGYTKGQEVQDFLKNENVSGLTFDEKINYYLYLYDRQKAYRASLNETYLKNIVNWGKSDTPITIVQNSYNLLNEGKIQSAISVVFDYYKNHFQLKSLMEMDELLQQLKSLRKEKRTNKEYNSYQTSKKIQNKLLEWLYEKQNR